jgi:spore coat protein H
MTNLQKRTFHWCMVLWLMLNGVVTGAQVTHPEGGFVYDDADLPRIDITMAGADLDRLYANPYSEEEYMAHFRFTRGGVAEELTSVGIRCRGNTSRGKDKKAFRLSFNTFEAGRDFHGIEKMHLNSETNDPSLVRSKLSWTLFRSLGIAGLRSNHVLLYINNDFYGVYINTEHVDEKFVRSRFNTNDGNLYKCLWPADLAYLGPGQDDYKTEYSGRRAYDLHINGEWDDYQDLADLIGAIENYSGTRFMEEVEKVINVQQYLKIMAVDVMTGNWDGYIGNKNNYYLYRDPVTGRFEYIPYDLDNTFGIDWLGEDWTVRSIYAWHREERPLYEKILQQEIYKQQYTGYIRKLAAFMTSTELEQEVERWRAQIAYWVGQDPYYPLDWGYTYADFENALTTGRGGHLPYGVMEYASLRAASALAECIQADAPPLVSHARVVPSPGRLRVDWTAEDDAAGFTTLFHYHIGDGEWQSSVPDAPSYTDPISGNLSCSDSLLGLPEEVRVDLYFTVMDNAGKETRYPSGTLSVEFPLADGPLRINEFMASNNNTYQDEYGEYDDWVEIFNPTAAPVWLGDLYLSDRVGIPGKYKFPDEFIGPGGFYLVWLDGQPEQGAGHAPFKISQGGEQIRLSGRPAEGFAIMDSITFGPQEPDVAFGRAPDGGNQWTAFSQATPGFSNLSTGHGEYMAGQEALILYPNPVVHGTLHFSRETSGIIYNMVGSAVLQVGFSDRADVGTLVPGIYLFQPDGGTPVRFIISGNR